MLERSIAVVELRVVCETFLLESPNTNRILELHFGLGYLAHVWIPARIWRSKGEGRGGLRCHRALSKVELQAMNYCPNKGPEAIQPTAKKGCANDGSWFFSRCMTQ
jgi:hypothetical protein